MTMQSTRQAQKALGYSIAALSGLGAGAATAAASVVLFAIIAV